MTATNKGSDTQRPARPEIPHGRPSSYTNHRCRCPECTEAWRVYCAELRERNLRNYVRLQAQLASD